MWKWEKYSVLGRLLCEKNLTGSGWASATFIQSTHTHNTSAFFLFFLFFLSASARVKKALKCSYNKVWLLTNTSLPLHSALHTAASKSQMKPYFFRSSSAGDTGCHLLSGVADCYRGNAALSRPGLFLYFYATCTTESKNKTIACQTFFLSFNERSFLNSPVSVKTCVRSPMTTPPTGCFFGYFQRDCCVCDESRPCVLCDFVFRCCLWARRRL